MSLKSFETVKKSRAVRAASCLHTKVEMATFHTEVMQLLAARPEGKVEGKVEGEG